MMHDVLQHNTLLRWQIVTDVSSFDMKEKHKNMFSGCIVGRPGPQIIPDTYETAFHALLAAL